MRPEGSTSYHDAVCALAVRPVPWHDSHTLFELAEDHCDEDGGSERWSCGLELLGGDLDRECWQVEQPVVEGRRYGIVWRRSSGLIFLVYDYTDERDRDPAPQAEFAYRRMLKLADEYGCAWPVRAWNFISGINEGHGDEERYRGFCLGRARALKQAGFHDSSLCAGTAIGGDQAVARIMLLCAAEPGVQIENPRQVSAYRYPRIYGPASPSFARATALGQADGSVLLLVSGTASVVGHESRHAGDLDSQIEEILDNLSSLMVASADRLNRPSLARAQRGILFRAYVRHREHWPQVRQRFAAAWPGCRMVGYRGDICRDELLVEVEAVVCG